MPSLKALSAIKMSKDEEQERRYLLAISGQICREYSADLRGFWSGFINIQRTVNVGNAKLDVVTHSWNPAYDELVRCVYNPIILLSESQPNFAPEYMPLINPVDRFERGLRRSTSTWKKCSPQGLLGIARSRAAVMASIDRLKDKNYLQVIATRWDQGLSGSKSVNRIIHDPALPADYLYMAYYSEIDEGYADMWFVAPVDIARRFAVYDDFLLDCLGGKNQYIEQFTKTGWPVALERNEFKRRFKFYLNLAVKKILSLKFMALISKFGPYAEGKVQGGVSRLRRFVELPEESGENALDFEINNCGRTWPAYQALNNHAVLKYFIYENGLRSRTRFLDVNDFSKSASYGVGTLINQKTFAHVIYSHSSFADCWKMAVGQAKENLPVNCMQIILLTEKSDRSIKEFEKLELDWPDIELLTYDEKLPYTDRLRNVFEMLSKHWPIIYFSHEDMPLIGKVDAYYMNALLHYFDYGNEYYIKLVDTSMVDEKIVHPGFPGLVLNTGGYSISVQPALIKPDEFAKFLTHFRCGIYDFENICEQSNFKASAVAGTKRIGKYLFTNDRFPLLCTAISKGKWCTSEWPDEIRELAERYDIDTACRGVV